jgi:hypothetical protein
MRRRAILAAIANLAWPWRSGLSAFVYPPPLINSNPAPSRMPPIKAPGPKGATVDPSEQTEPNFEDYATVESMVNGEPVYNFDYMMYVYGVSPDLIPGIVMQEGNTNSRVKIKPKKSWEIKNNLLGSTTEQPPRTRSNDTHPVLPIHLIDGDRETAWASFGSIAPDAYPEWIRIDLPIEATVASVALVCSKNFYPASNFGRALPKELTVKLSKDAWHWEEVYESRDVDVNTSDRLEIQFAPRRAKQIWIVGNNLTKQIHVPSSFASPGFFSIAEVEVRDPAGNNLALLSRGAGVTVSSTYYGHADNRLTQQALWGPLHYDMGMKWMRMTGCGIGAYQWAYIERERGRYEVDPVMDQWLSSLQRRGIKLILGLDVVGNPIYQDPPRNTDWSEVRRREFTDQTLGLTLSIQVDDSPGMFEAWLRYIDFMVRHFKDRAYIYEIGNEWNGPGWDDKRVERYMRIFEKAYEAVKKADPDARVMLGNPNLFAPDLLLTLLGQERKSGIRNGRLMASGGDANDLSRSTLVVARDLKVRDAEVVVDALNRGAFGVVIRYRNPQHYLVAGCLPRMIFIAEQTGDAWTTTRLTSKNIGWHFSTNLHIKVRVEGSGAALTVSDGNRNEMVNHLIKDQQLQDSGPIGLIQITGANQEFTNLQVTDLEGTILLRESFQGRNGDLPAGWKYARGPFLRNPIKPGWAPKIDGVGWHPNNPNDTPYFKAVREMQKQCAELGFKGGYYASEFYNFFSYPSFPFIPFSELQQGILSMISAVGHSGLGTVGNTQIIHFTGHASADSNCRLAWPAQVATSVQPSVMYYMWRTLATVLDDFHPAEFPVIFFNNKEFLWFTFARGEKERMVGVWIGRLGATLPSEFAEAPSDMLLPATRVERAWVIDLMNGTEQELTFKQVGADAHILGLRVKSYPTIVRFMQ